MFDKPLLTDDTGRSADTAMARIFMHASQGW